MIIPTDSTDHHHVIRYLRQGHVDGVLLISSHEADPLPRQLHELGIPAVISGPARVPAGRQLVDVDQRLGARLAAEHLLGRGCRRLATISGPLDIPSGSDRLDGFRSYLAGRGIPDVPAVEGDFTRHGGEECARRLPHRASRHRRAVRGQRPDGRGARCGPCRTWAGGCPTTWRWSASTTACAARSTAGRC
ncbi:hypothetical protein GCM10020358_57510 [Amorphoplanes nipponensis]